VTTANHHPPPLWYAGHNLLSAVALPSLRRSSSPELPASLRVLPSIWLDRLPAVPDWAHQWKDPDGNICLQLAYPATGNAPTPSWHRLRAPRVCDFVIEVAPGTATIRTEYDTEIAAETLEHLLIDQVLPRVLSEMGALVTHASCCKIADHCALFIGDSGWGKSTLVSLLQDCGHLPLSDDCVRLDNIAERVLATSTYPSLRLFTDSIEHVGIVSSALTSVAAYTGKRRISMPDQHPPEAVAVRAIYLLNNPQQPASTIRITPVSPAHACMALVGQGFRLDLTARHRNISFLQQAAEVARKVPAFTLSYPREYTQTNTLIAQLLQHLETL